jgi:hypothetical protein
MSRCEEAKCEEAKVGAKVDVQVRHGSSFLAAVSAANCKLVTGGPWTRLPSDFRILTYPALGVPRTSLLLSAVLTFAS